MNDDTNEKRNLIVDTENFSILCRVCLAHKELKVFQPNLMQFYARLLNVAEVIFHCHISCLVSISMFLAKEIFRSARTNLCRMCSSTGKYIKVRPYECKE